ncbi:DUF4132 domain-containing protein [Massilia genomosp. 1]|uniref:DUF4132 domain-containing protein n=1 Tax=Massilia genomosp. 1 TaxID=2609280 RepID=A0ABX0MW02_9BURK|nr:DUF4132 domain-containing protein [Massilia genomosp. 1]NHZ63712.1 DUF4132 domain-containing protein [Massilia genomosp. 1]
MSDDVSNPGDSAPWLSCGPLVDVPAAMAAIALSSRRFPGAPPRTDADQAWKLFLNHARKESPLDAARSDAPFQDGVIEATGRIAQGVRAGTPMSDAILLAVSTLFCDKLDASEGAPFVDFLVAEKGLPYALDVLLTCLEKMRLKRTYTDGVLAWHIAADRDLQFSRHSLLFSPTELALRAHLSHAAPALWEQCAQTLREAVPHMPEQRQALLAALLPDLPDMSDALVRARGFVLRSNDSWLNTTASASVRMQALESGNPHEGTNGFYEVPAAVAAVVLELGTEAVALLRSGVQIDLAAEGLTWIGTPDAVETLARRVLASDSGRALELLTTAVRRWPYAALAALAELIAPERYMPLTLRDLLAGLVETHVDALPAFKPWLTQSAAALLETIMARIASAGEIADVADLPPVLVNPPWLAARKKAKALALEPLALAPAAHWSDQEREQMRHENRDGVPTAFNDAFTVPRDAAQAAAVGDMVAVLAIWQKYAKPGDAAIGDLVHAFIDLPAPYNAAVWNALAGYAIKSPGYAVATLGLHGLPGYVTMCERRPGADLGYMRHIAAVELAAPMARAYVVLKAKEVRASARRWLLAYPEHAACGLIAPALGKPGAGCDQAADVLRMLAAAGHDALLMEVAGRYQQTAVSAALRALLDQDPLEMVPAKIAGAPAFWRVDTFTRPRLASNGKALSDHAIDLLGDMLRFPQGVRVYAGITQVRQACTPASLAAFAWDLFGAWELDFGNPKENWAFAAIGVLGDDDLARKLAPMIRAWPGEGLHARAGYGLDVLAAIGTETAMMLLSAIAQRGGTASLREKAREAITQVAAARNMTADELEDRLTPELGLDEQGTLLLDFGPRQFRVGFDEALKPYVRDQDGAPLADLPKPRQGDDAELARAATERYKTLKKDVRGIASQQVQRLEMAMCMRRRWTPEVFLACLAGHALVRHLVRRLVWGVYRGGRLESCFRVGLDGGVTDGADDAYVLAQGDDIGIAHAVEMSASDTQAFAQLFGDYELVQPFQQMGRDTYALSAAELASGRLLRWDGVVVPTGHLIGLTKRNWRRGRTQERSYVRDASKAMGGGLLAELTFEPGFMAAMVDQHPEQTLKQVLLTGPGTQGAPLAAPDPVAASELIRDLQQLCV